MSELVALSGTALLYVSGTVSSLAFLAVGALRLRSGAVRWPPTWLLLFFALANSRTYTVLSLLIGS